MAGFVWGDQPSSGYAAQGYGSSQPKNAGTFNNNQYQNPQMGMFNPNSQMDQYNASFQPSQSMWQGAAPGHHGQDYSYNPMTGQGGWENTAGGFQIGGSNPYGAGAVSWTDPKTGLRAINPDLLLGMFGAGGAGDNSGYENFTPSDYQQQMVTPGEGYGGFDYSTIGSGVDPGAVIAAQEYGLQEAMQGDFAQAGGRAGASGASMSTPYANQLGEAARKASQDRNALTMQYQYDAAQQQAQRDLAQQLQAGQLDFGGWQTGYQGDMNAQMFNSGQGLDIWNAQNQYGMMDNQGQNAWNMQQNQFNQQNQSQANSFLSNLLGGLL